MESSMNHGLIGAVKEEVAHRLDLGRDFSDDEIIDVITDVVFERSQSSYIDLRQKKPLSRQFLIP